LEWVVVLQEVEVLTLPLYLFQLLVELNQDQLVDIFFTHLVQEVQLLVYRQEWVQLMLQ
jgi:hypothetical protein